jgi:hypothetical protein
MIAISMFLIQFVQDRRTKAYQRSLGGPLQNREP